ncbi:nuclear transport factor 2 family protein [Chitinophaga sp. HK235]|uniref:nuclear transport factor 2 family protein n=1 Tax=Chitinophaga sp. HK235 TaxID=2952571 RepID=UPI001BA46DA5|nr:nuclear transport factor 2 family protein [Chitinophaga sp. HK235]
MRYLYVTLLCLLATASLKAQSDTAAVKHAVDKLFTAMHNSDSATLKECFSPNAVFQTISSENGKTEVKNVSVARFAEVIGKTPKGDADERITYGAIHIDAALASVWTPYRYYYQGQFHHCGVNVFQLVKLNGKWKIQYVIDTRRKDACVEEEKAGQ